MNLKKSKGMFMIDNHDEAMELVQKMEAQLPIIVHPGKVLIQSMREKGIKLASGQELEIEKVHYLGDEGGIGCGIRLATKEEGVMVVSLTNLRVIPGQPLTEEIWAYQLERTKKLTELHGFGKKFKFTMKSSKKRKRKKK
jgi:N6-adenosine-specific RNA methylase IME4